MKILLVGEYSNLHNSLKEGLLALGHEVTLVGTGDRFKNFPVDYSIEPKFSKIKIIFLLNKILKKINLCDIEKFERAILFWKFALIRNKYDHIQLINSDAIGSYPFLNKFLYKNIFKNTNSKSLLICGEEPPIVNFNLKEQEFYSVLIPLLENIKLKKDYNFTLKYTEKGYKKLFNFLVENCNQLITSDFDYEIPMSRMGYNTHFIPNPINTDKILYKENIINDKIIIFLGINTYSRYKKGIVLFEEALEKIKEKYSEKVEVIVTENVPYNEYIKLYEKAHILLDQAYSHDQGYNALTAMAQGKVVFTGAEKDWLNHFKLEENTVAINAKPDVGDIVQKLEWLINNPEEISKIGKNAREFIEREHHYITIAQRYLDVWGNNK